MRRLRTTVTILTGVRYTDFFPHGASVPERVQSTTAAPHMRPQRRGWPRRDRGPPPERTQPACSRLAAVGGSWRRQHALAFMCSTGSSGLSAASDRKHTAERLLDGLSRSGDAGGAGEHICEHIAGRNGREGYQGLRQAPAERAVCEGSAGEDSRGRGKGQGTLAENQLADVLPPAASVRRRALHRDGEAGCAAASATSNVVRGQHGRARTPAARLLGGCPDDAASLRGRAALSREPQLERGHHCRQQRSARSPHERGLRERPV